LFLRYYYITQGQTDWQGGGVTLATKHMTHNKECEHLYRGKERTLALAPIAEKNIHIDDL
jgi:hypothetical protein